MSIDTGGPAFPQTYQKCERHMEGMTLRDYFAAKALQGMLACDKETDYEEETLRREDYKQYCSIFAESAYDMADAMLKARQ